MNSDTLARDVHVLGLGDIELFLVDIDGVVACRLFLGTLLDQGAVVQGGEQLLVGAVLAGFFLEGDRFPVLYAFNS